MPIQARPKGEPSPPLPTQNDLSEIPPEEVSDGGEVLPPVVPFRGGYVYADDPEYLASLEQYSDEVTSVGDPEPAPEPDNDIASLHDKVTQHPPQQHDAVDQDALKLQKKVEFLRSCTPGVLAELYVRQRDERRAAEQVVKDHQAKMDTVASVIFEKMDQLNLDEFRPDSDKRTSVTDSEIRSATIYDKPAYLEFVKDQLLSGADPDALDYLENRASITTVDEYADVNNGELPPGIKLNRIRKLRVTVTQNRNGKKR